MSLHKKPDQIQNPPEGSLPEVQGVDNVLGCAKTCSEETSEEQMWASFSLGHAMVGMEDEPDLYAESDIKVIR